MDNPLYAVTPEQIHEVLMDEEFLVKLASAVQGRIYHHGNWQQDHIKEARCDMVKREGRKIERLRNVMASVHDLLQLVKS